MARRSIVALAVAVVFVAPAAASAGGQAPPVVDQYTEGVPTPGGILQPGGPDAGLTPTQVYRIRQRGGRDAVVLESVAASTSTAEGAPDTGAKQLLTALVLVVAVSIFALRTRGRS